MGHPSSGVAGSEGVGTVVKVGASVKHLSVNDMVVPSVPSFGTWQEMAVAKGDHLHKVSGNVTTAQGALLGQTSGTALRLLSDFSNLKKGDWIVQNGANGTIGQAVVQIAKAKGVKTINVFHGANDAMVETLQGMGGDIVVPDTYFATPEYKKLVKDLPKPKLGINCVGGESVTNMARSLANGAHLVTYGGVSRNGVTVPTSALVSNNLSLSGFSYAHWASDRSFAERDAMIQELVDLVSSGALAPADGEEFKFANFQKALETALEGHYSNGKLDQGRVIVNL